MTDPLFSRNSQRLRDHRHPKVREGLGGGRGGEGGHLARRHCTVVSSTPCFSCAALCWPPWLQTGAPAPLIADDVNDIIQANAERLDKEINYARDFE